MSLKYDPEWFCDFKENSEPRIQPSCKSTFWSHKKVGTLSRRLKNSFSFQYRIKSSSVGEGHLEHHPTEFFLSDGWTGASPNWLPFIFSYLETSEKSCQVCHPPDDLKRIGLRRIEKVEHQYLGDKFKVVDFVPKKEVWFSQTTAYCIVL